MKIPIRKFKPAAETQRTLDDIYPILSEYSGMAMTLRQLFYQLVAGLKIDNTEKSYKRIATIVVNARYGGMIDWDAIEDRTRRPILPNEFRDVADLVDRAVAWYELDYWQGQPIRPEVWVEKEALASIMEQAVDGLHVNLVVNRGYTSLSSLFDNAGRIIEYIEDGQGVHILYLGDHDSSGLDMLRDVRKRVHEFLRARLSDPSKSDDTEAFRVIHLALTHEQTTQYKLPPNPTKETDSRSKDYIEKYGADCWELDALNPQKLHELVEGAVKGYIVHPDRWFAMKDREKSEREELENLAKTRGGKDALE